MRQLGIHSIAAALFIVVTAAGDFDDSSTPTTPITQAVINAPDQEDLLWWLPADTESVVVARGPFAFPANEGQEKSGEERASQADIFREFEKQPLELLYGDSLDLAMLLRGSRVAFAMQGSRHFREPLPGLEVMDFEGCSIVVFDDSFGERGTNLMQSLETTATDTEEIQETRVLVFHQKSGEAEWDTFIVLPKANVLLVSNNLLFLREVLERMTQRKSKRALPDQLPEWRFLDSDTRFWALRHYDRQGGKGDPTSPFSDDGTRSSGDSKTIGILFALDPKDPRLAVITTFSGDEALIRNAVSEGTSSEEALIASFCGQEILTRDGGKSFEITTPKDSVQPEVTLRNPVPGVLQRTYALRQTGTISYFMFSMEVGLGRGMYI